MKRILLVDDEPHVMRITRLALENSGYRVDEAANGLQALEYFQDHHPDAMITDIDMPCMNGYDLCMKIKENMPDREFRIYVLTSRAEDEYRDLSTVIDDLKFIEKPVSVRQLLASLDEYFAEMEAGEKQSCRAER